VGGELILVIDDSNAIVSLLTEEILPAAGFVAYGARNGNLGLGLVARLQPALVLLDFELPDMTGLDVLRRMRESGHDMPTLLMTAYGSEAIAAEALRLGVRDYLIKPLTADEVVSAINKALTEHRLRQEATVLQAQITRLEHTLMAIHNVALLAVTRTASEEVLARILEAALYVSSAEAGFVALIDDSTSMTVRVARNVPGGEGQRIPLHPDEPFAQLVRRARPHRQAPAGAGPAALHVPLVARGMVLGVLSVSNKTSASEFSDLDERALSALGSYAALMIEIGRLGAAVAEERAGRAGERLTALGLKQGGTSA
jgi:two-component system NtrC family sensor kinase